MSMTGRDRMKRVMKDLERGLKPSSLRLTLPRRATTAGGHVYAAKLCFRFDLYISVSKRLQSLCITLSYMNSHEK